MALSKEFLQAKYPCFWLDSAYQVAEQNAAAGQLGLQPADIADKLTDGEKGSLRQGMPVQLPWSSLPHPMNSMHILPFAAGYVAILQPAAVSKAGHMLAAERMMKDAQGLAAALPAMQFFLDDSDAGHQMARYGMCQTYRMMRAINDQLWCQRMAAGYQPQPQALDLNAVLGDLCGSINAALPEAGVRYTGPGNRVPVLLDRALLELAVTHLVNNSVTYAREGSGVELKLQLTENRILLQVRDGGKGMQPQVATRAFEPYFSCDPYCDTDITPGNGLGLYLVRQAVRAMGGECALETDYGVGTTVSLALPLEQASIQELQLQSALADYLMDRTSCVYLQFAPLGAQLR